MICNHRQLMLMKSWQLQGLKKDAMMLVEKPGAVDVLLPYAA